MEYYDININQLKDKREKLYQKITESNDELAMSCGYKVNIAKSNDGDITFNIEKNNYLYRLNSLYDMEYETEIFISSLELNALNKTIIVFGLGNAYYIKKLLQKINTNDIVIIYEPSLMIFKSLIDNIDITDLLKNNIYIFVGDEDRDDLRKHITTFVYWNNLKSQKLIILPQYEHLFTKELKDVLKIIHDNNARAVLMQNTNAFFGKIIITNIFSNMQYLTDCNIINDYVGKFPEYVPAIIVSAGPSLLKNIKELRRAKGKAVIFGVDRALEYLYKEGIEPDYTVSIDPVKPIKFFAEGYSVKVPLFVEMQSNKDILDVHEGKKVFYDAFGFIDEALEKAGKKIDSEYFYGQSVATATFTLCIKMGFKTIIQIGQDLSYAEDGKTAYAGNASQTCNDFEIVTVEGNYSKEVKTRLDWYEFIIWFQDKINDSKELGIEFINATEGGAKISGTTVMTLAEAIDKYCNSQIDIKNIESSMNTTYNAKDIQKVKKSIGQGYMDLNKIRTKADKAITICDKMIKKCEKKTYKDKTSSVLTSQLMRINSYMAAKSIFALVNSYITSDIKSTMANVFQVEKDEVQNNKNTFLQGREVYGNIIKAVGEIQQIMIKYTDDSVIDKGEL